MRSSDPMPRRTMSTSAPAASQSWAMEFMNEMRVASMALAAYLVISADGMSMRRMALPVAHEGRVEILQDLPGEVRVHAQDDPVRLHEVVDRRALLEELGVGADVHGEVGVGLDLGADLRRGAHGHRALGDDDLLAVHGLADGACHRQHVLEVGGAVLAGGRAHGDEDDVRGPHRLGPRRW